MTYFFKSYAVSVNASGSEATPLLTLGSGPCSFMITVPADKSPVVIDGNQSTLTANGYSAEYNYSVPAGGSSPVFDNVQAQVYALGSAATTVIVTIWGS